MKLNRLLYALPLQLQRPRWGVTCFLFLCVLLRPLAAQEAELPRVGVIPPQNLSDLPQYDIVAEVIYNTTELTLRLIGEYKVVALPAATPVDPEGLRDLGLEQNLANIVLGRIHEQDGRLSLEMSVFDTLAEEIVLTRTEEPESLLAVFESTDILVADVVQEFSGVPVGFGDLVLRNTGEPGSYQVLLDGALLGADLERVERILIGSRELEIRQERMFGEYTVLRQDLQIVTAQTTALEFAVPELVPRESQALEFFERELTEQIEAPRSEERVRELFANAAALLEDTSYSPGLAAYRSRFATLEQDWEAGIEEWRLALRPRWIFPISVGWFAALSGENDQAPVGWVSAQRRLGDSLYLGLDVVVVPDLAYPLPSISWRPGDAELLLMTTLLPLPGELMGKIGVAYRRLSVHFLFISNVPPDTSASDDSEIQLGFSVGYVF
ncbi:MAG: hypothetical protein EA428_11560 [Spirochaetaceae bacterium]|nr:MAG: hypothetical protein EA428_11560 [Spirochaetaceae bacterium]